MAYVPICACMHVCMYASMHLCIHAYMHGCRDARMHEGMYAMYACNACHADVVRCNEIRWDELACIAMPCVLYVYACLFACTHM